MDGGDPKSKLVLANKRDLKQVSNSVHDNARHLSSQLHGMRVGGTGEWERQLPYPQGTNRAQVLKQARDHSKLLEKQWHLKKSQGGLDLPSPHEGSGTTLKKYPLASIPLMRNKSPRSLALQNLSPSKKKNLYEKHHFGLSNNRVNLSPLNHSSLQQVQGVFLLPSKASGIIDTDEADRGSDHQNQRLRPHRRDSTVRNQELLKQKT